MNKLTLRCSTLSVFVVALLLITAMGAAAADESAQRTPQAREASRALALPQAIACPACALAFEKCFASCFAGVGKGTKDACLMACNKAAVTCTCDEAVTLRSEDLVKWGIASATKEATCHGWVSCQPNYPSCAGWSGFIYACGEPQCLLGPYCVECTEESCPTEAPYVSAPVERFRVCFDQFGNSCTEWQLVDYPACGCEL